MKDCLRCFEVLHPLQQWEILRAYVIVAMNRSRTSFNAPSPRFLPSLAHCLKQPQQTRRDALCTAWQTARQHMINHLLLITCCSNWELLMVPSTCLPMLSNKQHVCFIVLLLRSRNVVQWHTQTHSNTQQHPTLGTAKQTSMLWSVVSNSAYLFRMSMYRFIFDYVVTCVACMQL